MTDLPDTSPNLGLPFYQTKLNEFEVQHNEALLMLDALVMLAVKDRDLSAPPSSPALGDRYLVKAVGTGAFAGKDNRIGQYDTGGWNFYAPQEGWTCYVQDEQVLIAWDGTAWQPALDVLGTITDIENLSLLGIGTTADTTNPLSAKLNNALWTAKTVAEGGDGTLRYKLSKESASKTLSFLFQDNSSGRAEVGLTGDDDFHFKVSADGTTWLEAIKIDRTTGVVTFPHNLSSFVPADLDITLAELALGLADALNVAQFLGSAGNRLADSFDALTYVNTAGATNLDTSTAGRLKPTMSAGSQISTSGKTKVGNMTGGGGLAAAFDGTTSQAQAASANVASTSDYTNTVGVDWGSGVTNAIGRVKIYGPSDANVLGAAGGTTFKLQGSTDNFASSIVDLTAAISIPTGTAQSVDVTSGIDVSAPYRYHRVAFAGNGINTVAAAEVQLFSSLAGNMTVTSTSLAAAAAPTSAKLIARVKEIDAITLNTDLIFYVSRDGGTTYTAFAMTDRFTTSNLYVLESASLDISGQPSGTSMRWKAVSANNKNSELHDVYLYWS